MIDPTIETETTEERDARWARIREQERARYDARNRPAPVDDSDLAVAVILSRLILLKTSATESDRTLARTVVDRWGDIAQW